MPQKPYRNSHSHTQKGHINTSETWAALNIFKQINFWCGYEKKKIYIIHIFKCQSLKGEITHQDKCFTEI